MKEVIETVSEVELKSIALIVAVALLGMGATWWVLTATASPALTAGEQAYGLGSAAEVQREDQLSTTGIQPNEVQEQPQVLVETGNRTAVTPQPDELKGSEARERGFAVQLGAFQQEAGAKRRLKELQDQGYEVHLAFHEEDGSFIFRLVAGEFTTREEAAAAAKGLKESGIDAFVREQ